MSNDPFTLLSQFTDACIGFDVNVTDSRASLSQSLDSIAAELGKNEDARVHMASDEFWLISRKLWRDLVHAQLTFWDGDDSDDEDDEGDEDSNPKERIQRQPSLSAFCVSLARFTRNLVAGVPANQSKAFENEPEMRRLLHYYTSWSSMKDQEAILAARILTQMLSNIITGNNVLMCSLWETYLGLPEDQAVLIRLLSSPDTRTLLAVLTMIRNCIHASKTRAKMLTRTLIGARMCVSLLDNMVKLYDAEEASDGARAFDVGYSIFTRIIEVGLIPDLYKKLSVQDEIVSPHQTTLLKIVDSYLQSTPVVSPTKSSLIKIHANLSPLLSECFFSQSSYAQNAIRRSLRPTASEIDSTVGDASPVAELDVMLPKVCEALVLVAQCIVTVTLASQNQQIHPASGSSSSATGSQENLHAFFSQSLNGGVGLVESLIELLRLLDKFLPRINFGKPVTPRPPAAEDSTQQSATTPGHSGFNYLKRDLVRLLGILCHEAKGVQDRIRNCGGIEVVMNLCVIDERNPYLREHAILALHNLLKGNAANQAVVEELKPTTQWDENGVLTETMSR